MQPISQEQAQEIVMRRWGFVAKKTSRGEIHSPCFACGGKLRFIVFLDTGGYWCRQCGAKGFLDDDRKRYKPDPVLLQKWRDEIQSEKDAQTAKDLEWRNGFVAGYAQGWHDALNMTNRAWWNEQGISNRLIDKYNLGYIPSKTIETEHGKIEIPAYTIPIMDIETYEIANVQYRLVDPPEGVGKYRQAHGISAREFYADLCQIDTSAAIVLEGAKKAIVTFDRLEGAIQVVGLPGCSPSDTIVERLKRYGKIWIALDPGAEGAAHRLKERLPQARIMQLPGKPDDLWIGGGMTVERFKNYMRQSR